MATIPQPGAKLSPREDDVLGAFVRGGYTAKEVARELGISHRTVETHLRNAAIKMDARNQLHALLLWDRAHRSRPE